MVRYSVKQLALLAGVSIRTLHLYDHMGLLKPQARTEARYRLYGEPELLRLQQILFYRELDFPLQKIRDILDHPDFELVSALETHKNILEARKQRIDTLLNTLDQTIVTLKEGHMLTHETLYEGLPKETAANYRQEAQEQYGTEAIQRSEKALRKLSKEQFTQLKQEAELLRNELATHLHEDPTAPAVQVLIAQHYDQIRIFWGTTGSEDPQAATYKGLGTLYVSDERFSLIDGKPNRTYALFMQKAMVHFADTVLC